MSYRFDKFYIMSYRFNLANDYSQRRWRCFDKPEIPEFFGEYLGIHYITAGIIYRMRLLCKPLDKENEATTHIMKKKNTLTNTDNRYTYTYTDIRTYRYSNKQGSKVYLKLF